jgi:hypothetical protein
MKNIQTITKSDYQENNQIISYGETYAGHPSQRVLHYSHRKDSENKHRIVCYG